MASQEENLKSMLQRAGCSAQVVTGIVNAGLKSIHTFSNADVDKVVVAMNFGEADIAGPASLKTAHQLAKVEAARTVALLSADAAMVTDQDKDRKELNKKWKEKYTCLPPPEYRVEDEVLKVLKAQHFQGYPSFFSLKKIGGGASEESEGALEVGEDGKIRKAKKGHTEVKGMFDLQTRLFCLMYGYVYVGMLEKSQAEAYVIHFIKKCQAPPKHSMAAVLNVDEKVRRFWNTEVRDNEVKFDDAVRLSITSNQDLFHEITREYSPTARRMPNPDGGLLKPPPVLETPGPGDNKNPELMKLLKRKSGEKDICFDFNNERNKCQNKCPNDRAHVCRICLSKDHAVYQCPQFQQFKRQKASH